jgi:hypothetical protein
MVTAAPGYQLGPITVKGKPKLIIMKISRPKKGKEALVSFVVSKKTIYQATLDQALPFLLPALKHSHVSWSVGYVQFESDTPEILTSTGRLGLIEQLCSDAFYTIKPMGAPLSHELKANVIQNLGTAQEADTLLGLWNTEQEYEGGGLRGDGYLKRPLVPQKIRRKGQIGGWVNTRDNNLPEVPNAIALKIYPGFIRITGPRGQQISVPFRILLQSAPKGPEIPVNSLFFLWARTLMCCGQNDLKGPLGSGVRDLYFAERLVKDKESDALAQRWQGKTEKAWNFEGNVQDQTFKGELSDQEQSQHVLGVMDVSASCVVTCDNDHTSKVHLVAVRGFGRWNKPGELVISRMHTSKGKVLDPCPLRIASGIRLLVGHDLEAKTKALEASSTSKVKGSSTDKTTKIKMSP